MSPSEREFATKCLLDGRDTLLRAIAGLSEAQQRFKVQPEDWSITDCVEHVALVEDLLFPLVTQGVVSPNAVSLDPAKDERMGCGRRGSETQSFSATSHASERRLRIRSRGGRQVPRRKNAPVKMRQPELRYFLAQSSFGAVLLSKKCRLEQACDFPSDLITLQCQHRVKRRSRDTRLHVPKTGGFQQRAVLSE
jgi:hypothetical protein